MAVIERSMVIDVPPTELMKLLQEPQRIPEFAPVVDRVDAIRHEKNSERLLESLKMIAEAESARKA